MNRRASIRAAERERTDAERHLEERDLRRRDHELALRTNRHEADLQARRRESALRREQAGEAMRVIREAARERLEHLSDLHARVDVARAAVADAQRAVRTAVTGRRVLRETTDAELRAIRAHRDRLFYAYCSANVRARRDHVAPACLQVVPPLTLPEEFRDPIVRAA